MRFQVGDTVKIAKNHIWRLYSDRKGEAKVIEIDIEGDAARIEFGDNSDLIFWCLESTLRLVRRG